MDTETELEGRFRDAEKRLLDGYGLTYTERFIEVLGTRVRVVDIPATRDGAALPPVILLHGIASVTAAAAPLLPAFGGARIIAPDWPGHGLSGPHEFRPRDDLRAFARAVIDAVADDAGVTRFDLVGHSLGGQFALYYTLARPQRVRRLVLLGAPGAAFAELHPPAGMRIVALPGVGRRLLSRAVTLEQYRANSAMTLGAGAVDPWPPELVEVGWYASQRRAFVDTLPGLFRSIASIFGVRRSAVIPHDELAIITTPTLLLWGDRDVFVTPERARPSWGRMPAAVLADIRNAGHAPWLNDLSASSTALRTFLDDVTDPEPAPR
jgi:pimeloyl-ACP methyl ester carboxylesterase